MRTGNIKRRKGCHHLAILRVFTAAAFITGLFSLFSIDIELRFAPLPVAALLTSICGWICLCSIFIKKDFRGELWESLLVCGCAFWCSLFLLFLDTGKFLSEIWREVMACAITIVLFLMLKKLLISFYEKAYDATLSKDNVSSVAFHEAGHICVSALCPSVVLKAEINGKLSGHVICSGQMDDRVIMLQLLGGAIAEESVFGISSGGSGDIRKWDETALNWLNSKGFGWGRKHELLFRQRKYLLDFFHENFQPLLLVAMAINDRGKMDHDEIAGFLAMIKYEDYSDIFNL